MISKNSILNIICVFKIIVILVGALFLYESYQANKILLKTNVDLETRINQTESLVSFYIHHSNTMDEYWNLWEVENELEK